MSVHGRIGRWSGLPKGFTKKFQSGPETRGESGRSFVLKRAVHGPSSAASISSAHQCFNVPLVAAVLLWLCVSALAAPTTVEQARSAVKRWLQGGRAVLGKSLKPQVKEIQTYKNAQGEPLYYVVYLAPSGFVIVPGDDLVEPIICFASEGEYDPSDTNPLGALVSRDLPGRVKAVRAEKGAPDHAPSVANTKWHALLDRDQGDTETSQEMGISAVSDERVSPFVESKWSQTTVSGNACYNYYTPPYSAGSSSNYPCGCVATAMAQLMRFHQHPTSGVGTTSFTIWVDGSSQSRALRGGDGSGGPYSWADMVLVPSSSTTATERQAIGALCHDAGVSVNMAYTSSESGTDTLKAREAFVDTFGYSNAVKGYNSGSNIGSGLNGMVNPNLDAGYPVVLGITGSSGGHAIVCDGYGYDSATLYHHLNLGWAGSSDAWYNLPNIDAGGYTFTSVYKCIYNVYVTGSGEIMSGRVTDLEGNPLSGVTVTAEISGGASYTGTTNARGIYAIPKTPSATQYTVSAEKSGYTFQSHTVHTGTSVNWVPTSGNVWGVDFVGGAIPDAPVLEAEPANTPGTTNTISWAAVTGAEQYYAECDTSDAFPLPDANSGWIAGFSHEFTGLTEGETYYYHAKARKVITGGSQAWSQTTRSDFQTNAMSNTCAISPKDAGAVVLDGNAGIGETVGGSTYSVTNSSYWVGNYFECTTSRTLTEIEAYLNITSSVALELAVYEADSQSGTYWYIDSALIPSSGTGQKFYSSGKMSVPLTSGKFYCIAMSCSGTGVSYYSTSSPALAFGSAFSFAYYDGGLSHLGYDFGTVSSEVWRFYHRLTTSPGYQTSGTVQCAGMNPASFDRWGTLTYTKTTPANTTLTIDVLDGADTVIASSVGSGTDLNGLGITQKPIKLRANLATTDTSVTPYLKDWSLTYQETDYYPTSAWSNVEHSTQGTVLGISLDPYPATWAISGVQPTGATCVSTSETRVKVTNTGNVSETFQLKIAAQDQEEWGEETGAWTSGASAGENLYMLRGLFCGGEDSPGASDFQSDDLITTSVQDATATRFAYNDNHALSVAVSQFLYLWFRLDLPTSVSGDHAGDEHEITVEVSCVQAE